MRVRNKCNVCSETSVVYGLETSVYVGVAVYSTDEWRAKYFDRRVQGK